MAVSPSPPRSCYWGLMPRPGSSQESSRHHAQGSVGQTSNTRCLWQVTDNSWENYQIFICSYLQYLGGEYDDDPWLEEILEFLPSTDTTHPWTGQWKLVANMSRNNKYHAVSVIPYSQVDQFCNEDWLVSLTFNYVGLLKPYSQKNLLNSASEAS